VLLKALTKVAAVAVLHHYVDAELSVLERLDERLTRTHEAFVLQLAHDSVLFERRIPLNSVDNVNTLHRHEL
jgi:hypothetical protein